MSHNVKIFRYNPENGKTGKLVDYSVKINPGMSVLDLLHRVHDEQDGSLAYRYSCRGAICGTCAIRINGTARLACKTQVNDLLEEEKSITLEPLSNMGIIKDLVVDKRPFWESIKKTMPWLVRENELADERLNYETKLDKVHLDQLNRSADCIKCACCFADCPKVEETPEFIGPAVSVQVYRQMFDPRDTKLDERLTFSTAEGGVFDCDKHAACVKVCPKDCRPLRAITFIQNKSKQVVQ
ncbi:hypothetical protein B6I21_08715 [candidate division KSB1 bacterium 4572_119]|nr:MAG: hypothetical protein B6I21_08715 [candidate division KSB1 bacterium 4572_119]